MSRPVPFFLKAQVLFGGKLNRLGWIFLGAGLAFCWIFVANADVSFLTMRGELATAQGIVSHSERTKASEGGTKHSRGTPVFATYYSFENGRKTFKGVSYATGRSYDTGATVTVEFKKNDPAVSRIEGMRRATFGSGALFVVAFPIVGLAMILTGLKKGIRAINLLSNGVLAAGRLKAKEPTTTRISNRPVYKLVFEFVTEDGQIHEATTRTHLTEQLEDNECEPLVYQPWQPSNAVMVDDLPGSPRFDDLGQLHGGSSAGFLGAIVFPVLSIVGNGVYILMVLLK